ncbi:MAG: hypothetical protein ACE5D0_10550 [Fidelibacterota bacterium]
MESGAHRITVKMRDLSITESFTFNEEMVIAVIYWRTEDKILLDYFEDGDYPPPMDNHSIRDLTSSQNEA